MGPPLSQPPTNNRTFCNERSLLRAPEYLGRRSRRLPRGVPSPPREESSHPRESLGTGLFMKANNSSSRASPERSCRVSSVPQPPGSARREGPGGKVCGCPPPCPTQPGRPSSPRHKAHCPYSFGLCSHMANPCRHSQHPFIQAHNVPQQGTIGTLFASIIDANGRQREREREKKSFNYKRYPANYEPYVPIVSKQSNEVHFKSRLLY